MKMLFVKKIKKRITDFKSMEIKRSLWKEIKGGGGENIIIEDLVDG